MTQRNTKNERSGLIIGGFIIVCLLLLYARGMVYLPADGLTAIQKVPYWMAGDENGTVGDYHSYLKTRSEINLRYDDLTHLHGLSFRNGNRFHFFRMYLFVDFVFAYLLICFAMLIAKNLGGSSSGIKLEWGRNVFTALAVLVIFSDLAENSMLLYLSLGLKTYAIFHTIKTILYGFFFLLLAYKVLQALRSPSGKAVRKVMISSWLSLLVISFIIILLTKMAQGVNLMVDLFSDFSNTLLFFILLSFSAVVISHYAKFMYVRIHAQDQYRWVWSRFKWPIIYHYPKKRGSGSDLFESLFRHFLGSIFIIACFYAYLFAWNKTNLFFPDSVVTQFVLLLATAAFLTHYYLYSLLEKYKSTGERKKEIRRWLWVFINANVLILILFIIRQIVDEGSSWIRLFPFFLFLLTLVGYVVFRELRPSFAEFMGIRSRFRYKEIKELAGKDQQEMMKVSLVNELPSEPLAYGMLSYVGNFTNNIFLHIVISVLRFILLIAFFSLPFTWLALHVNGVNYLLAYLILFYSLILTFLKFQFYKNPKWANQNGYVENEQLVELSQYARKKNIDLKKTYIRDLFVGPLVSFKQKTSYNSRNIAFLLVISGVGILAVGNNLHLLRPIYVASSGMEEEREVHYASVNKDEIKVEVDEFLEVFQNAMDPDKEVVVALTAFGGGLKANYNVLRTMSNIKTEIPHIMDHTLLMSGVSGGGVGLANYNLLDNYKQHGSEAISRKVDAIGGLNILSLDLYHLLYLDLFRMFIPRLPSASLPSRPLSTRSYGHDRSFHAMKQYEMIISPDEVLDSIPYQNIHRRILDRGHHSPLLLMNSTSTSLEYGVASSVSFQGSSIPGAINILNPLGGLDSAEHYTLGYYDAVSTVNRFPLMSPAAKIKDAGYFVDGGYFENSGLLSAISVLDRLSGHAWSPDQHITLDSSEYKVVIVSMLNGKVHWINQVLGASGLEQKSTVNSSSQIGAIMKTVVGTEMLPNFFVEALAEEAVENSETFSFIPFYIPYRLSMKDIDAYLGGKPYNYYDMRKVIEENNFTIDSLLNAHNYNLGWGIVQPALSRKLSKEDKQYQDIMIVNHPFNREKLEELKNELE